MAEYAILIYENEAGFANASPDDWTRMMQAHRAFAEQVAARGGKILGGNALRPTTTATSIRGGKATAGPFVTTPEVPTGYYVIDAKDDAHAVEIATLCPAGYGGVEVRPIMPTG